MHPRPLLIITTRLSPQVCGIGTYSWLLHQHWPRDRQETRFLVVDGAAPSIKDLNYPAISEFNSSARTLDRELDRIGAVDVLLHYASLAYHRFGCPWWLPSVLAKWKKKFPSGRLMILFHELPGNFPIMSRHFWIDMCNLRVIRKLSSLADLIVTNTNEHAEELAKISRRTDIHWLPVPSNIPIAANLAEPRARSEFVIFGLPFGRWQTLQIFDAEIRSWLETGRLTRLHIVGPPAERFDARSAELMARWLDPNIVVRHGMLPSVEVSKLLARVQFGLVNATVENWSKSAVFMAFASHGCAIVSKIESDPPPLRFTVAPDEVATIDDVCLSERTRALQQWYQLHADWDVIARKISALLPAKMEEEAMV